MSSKPRPIAANFHLIASCNARCEFCFATFRDVRDRLSLPDAWRLIEVLQEAGVEKLNFAGGEPTLHPHVGILIAHAKATGLVTSIVTNGFKLGQVLAEHAGSLDWAGLSIDSGVESVQARLGRGKGDHVSQATDLAIRCQRLGVKVKVNTVVTRSTWEEDMSPLIRRIQPDRWKVFQVLGIEDQNTGEVEKHLIDDAQFKAFVDRHEHLVTDGLAPIVEDNDAMLGSYVMIDPLGRFFGNATGRHVYSESILEVGVDEALSQVGFVPEKFDARGGRYAW